MRKLSIALYGELVVGDNMDLHDRLQNEGMMLMRKDSIALNCTR